MVTESALQPLGSCAINKPFFLELGLTDDRTCHLMHALLSGAETESRAMALENERLRTELDCFKQASGGNSASVQLQVGRQAMGWCGLLQPYVLTIVYDNHGCPDAVHTHASRSPTSSWIRPAP